MIFLFKFLNMKINDFLKNNIISFHYVLTEIVIIYLKF